MIEPASCAIHLSLLFPWGPKQFEATLMLPSGRSGAAETRQGGGPRCRAVAARLMAGAWA